MVKQCITIYEIVFGEEFETIFKILVIADTPKHKPASIFPSANSLTIRVK